MRKVMVLGDTHANTRWTIDAIGIASSLDVKDIIVVGDFGYWPDAIYGHPEFLHSISPAAVESGVTVWWVDGNHEDFGSLYANHLKDHDEPVKILDGIMWLPRGVAWEWEGVKFMAMGGAASIDRQWRTNGLDWFSEEMISDDDVAKATDCDIIISHDSPVNPLEAAGRSFSVDPDSEHCRMQMRRVVSISKPDLVLYGHYHMSSDLDFLRDGGYTRCVSLNCDGNLESMRLLYLDAGDWKLSSAFPIMADPILESLDQDAIERQDARLMW